MTYGGSVIQCHEIKSQELDIRALLNGLCGKRVVDIAMGGTHCLALTEDGEVYSWGKNEKGQLGDGFYNSKYEPGLVATLEGKNIVGICCGVNQVRTDCNLFYILVPYN